MKIRADLRFLATEQPTSFLTSDYYAGGTSFALDNSAEFSTNDYILIGQLANETTEIVKISGISGNTITTNATTFDHPQDTIITKIDYNAINFFHSATATGVLTALNLSPQTITPDSVFNSYDDTSNTTGYGWYRFNNTTTAVSSTLSNAVPYAGWADNSVKLMLDTFYTQISNRNRKLIKDEDAIRWLNEAYTIARNRLNLSNREYTVPTPYTIAITSGTAEYALPDYFSKVRVVTDESGIPIPWVAYEEVPNYVNSVVPPGGTLAIKYYLRGNYIGFAPTPATTVNYLLYYQRTAPVLSSYIDYIELPNANHYFLLDFMLYRATMIIGGNPDAHLKDFDRGLADLVVSSHKQSGNRDSWSIDPRTIV